MTSWGGYHNVGGNGMRVGINAYVATGVDTNSGSVLIRVEYYVQNLYRYNDFQWLDTWGDSGGRIDYNNQGNAGVVLHLGTRDVWYNYSTWGSSPGNYNFYAQVGGAYNGSTPSHGVSVGIPARPYAAPYSPYSVTAVRNSDSQATVSWTNQPTAQRPYTSITVEMRTYDGAWGAWTTVATVGSTATSYVRTGLSANRAYTFRVRANNTVGSGSFNESGTIYTSPGGPTSVTAVRGTSGTDVRVSWVPTVVYGAMDYEVQRKVDTGSWTTIATVTDGSNTYLDSSAGGGTNTYRVRTKGKGGATGLYSGYVESNSVTVAVPPLAPTLLDPDGAKIDLNAAHTLTWKHVGGADNAAQSSYEVQVSNDSGSTWTAWTSGQVASSSGSATLPAAALPNGAVYLWRVRTRSSTLADWGPWSAGATFTGTTAPTVTIVVGFPPPVVQVLPPSVDWVYNQDQGSPQTAWEVEITDPLGTALFRDSGSGSVSSYLFDSYDFVNLTEYRVRVRTKSGFDLWSEWATATFEIDLLPPAQATIVSFTDPCRGRIALTLEGLDPQEGATVPIETAMVERRILGETDWTLFASGIPLPATISDPTSPLAGIVEYRAISVSVDGLRATGPTATVPLSSTDYWGFLSWGPSFSNIVRLRSDLKVDETDSRNSRTQHFLGRKHPVGLFGKNIGTELSVSGTPVAAPLGCAPGDECNWDSPVSDWRKAAHEAEVVMWRDYTGRRLYARMGAVSIAQGPRPGVNGVSTTLTQVDFTERPYYVEEPKYDRVDVTPPNLLTTTSLWRSFGFGYAWSQPGVVRNGDALDLPWNPAPAEDTGVGMYGYPQIFEIGKVYEIEALVVVEIGMAEWRVSVAFNASSPDRLVPTGAPQKIRWLWTANVASGHPGIEVFKPASGWAAAGTHTVIEFTVTRRDPR